MLDFDEGRIPESESKLTTLIDELGVAAEDGARLELGRALFDRATVRRFSNRPEDALSDVDAALRVAEALPMLQRRAALVTALGLRARIVVSQVSVGGDVLAANAAIARLRELTSGWQTDELESELAFQEASWNRAAELALSAARQLAAQGWVIPVASLRRRAGEAYLELGALDRAEEELRAAYDVLERSWSPDRIAAVRRTLARLEHAKGDHDAAWEHSLAALDGVESLIRHFRLLADQQRFVEDKLPYYDLAFDVGLARGGSIGLERAWAVAERAKSFYLCQLVANADVPLFEGVDPSRVERLRALEDELDTLERADARGRPADELEERSREKQELLDALMRENPRWAGLRAPPALDLVAELESLGPSWTALSYYWREDGSSTTLYMFLRPPAGEPELVTSVWSPDELERLRESADALQGHVPVAAPILPADLAAKIFPDELEPLLEGSRRLLVSPHDQLRALPLHASDAGRGWLPISRWPIVYIPTLSLLRLRGERAPAERVLLIGSADNAFGDQTLREIGREIDEIGSTWDTTRPGQVTRRIVGAGESPAGAGVGIDSWGECEYVHVACHGYFPEGRPLDAALRLGTDAVRASEFFATRLDARLVSLSACSLGRQERGGALLGDEWVGLYAPLFYAGAEAVLVSVWDAYSREAAEFMIALHRSIAAGAEPATAFFEAVSVLCAKPLPLWANWYLAGVPGDDEEG
jgi:hypothetical protein